MRLRSLHSLHGLHGLDVGAEINSAMLSSAYNSCLGGEYILSIEGPRSHKLPINGQTQHNFPLEEYRLNEFSFEVFSPIQSPLEGTTHLKSSLKGAIHLNSSSEGPTHLKFPLEGTIHRKSPPRPAGVPLFGKGGLRGGYMPKILRYAPKLKEIARMLGKNSTLAEVLLWKRLRKFKWMTPNLQWLKTPSANKQVTI